MTDLAAPRPDLPLMMAAAFGHPDALFRQTLRARLETWAESLVPRFSETRISDCLQACHGTALEPFALTPHELAIAVLTTRIAFSERLNEQRLRIISPETIGVRGGLVLTSNLASYYVERVSFGRHRHTPLSWYVAPGCFPEGTEPSAATWYPVRATATRTRHRTVVTVPELHGADLTSAALTSAKASVMNHSAAGYDTLTTTLDELGIKVTRYLGGLIITAKQPQARARLEDLMDQRALVEIQFEALQDHPSPARLLLRLAPLSMSSGDCSLTAVTTYFPPESTAIPWMQVTSAPSIALDLEDRAAIGRWLQPADECLDEAVVERLLPVL